MARQSPTETLDLQYPIGRLTLPETLSPEARQAAIDELSPFPRHLAAALEDLADPQLDTPYRPDDRTAPVRQAVWAIRQIVHHLADSHATAYSWVRRALSNGHPAEPWPTVFAYDPAAIADLDSRLPAQISPAHSPKVSLQLIEALHQRWTATLQSVRDEEWQTRGCTHPETGPCPLGQALAMYAWHGRHHQAQIQNFRHRHGWS